MVGMFSVGHISMMVSFTVVVVVVVSFVARLVGISVDSRFFMVTVHLRVMGNVVCMIRLLSVLLRVKMLRPLIVVMGFYMVGASRGLGQSFTGSTGFILVGMMMGFNMRSTLGSNRVLRFSKGVRSTISTRDITR